jgi:hypothetical protein
MQFYVPPPWNPTEPIRVIIQQPTGLPVWISTLIGSAVGAAFVFLTQFAMEFIKPWRERKHKRKLVDWHLALELIRAMESVEGVISHLERMMSGRADMDNMMKPITAQRALTKLNVHHAQFDSFVKTDLDVVNEIDVDHLLTEFYERSDRYADIKDSIAESYMHSRRT